MPHRALTEQIPDYLQPYIVQQDASYYTSIDHASWRFILKISQAFFAKHAHQMYLDGLKATGISTDRIPLIEEMDQCLRKFNWRAVAVSGFIPPAVFMEFLSRGVLPIACDMRKLENLAYTPAPDIVHEAAGHAPIIADREYADYLRHYGELAEKAIYSSQDLEVYNAVRNLSEVKEDPNSTPEEIDDAQRLLDDRVAAVDHDTEATQLGRMGWWTIEYGLIGESGDGKSPKIYGAGLLSSVHESFHCLGSGVKKIPFSVDCVDMTYDITKPQPQLYVAPDFQALKRGLDELAERMSFRRGGVEGLEKARQAALTTTVVLDSGIQISGTLTRYDLDPAKNPTYLKFTGPCQLSYQDQELEGQGAQYHRDGFGTVLGKIDLPRVGERVRRTFESGIVLEGTLKSKIERDGKTQILSFENCKVTQGSEVLFDPAWGIFDLACGTRVVSVFGGAADRKKYLAETGGFKQRPGKQKSNLTPSNKGLNALYARVRKLRDEAAESGKPDAAALSEVHGALETQYPQDWLLRYELLELDSKYKLGSSWSTPIRKRFDEISRGDSSKAEMIGRGLELL
jgi:phenylalanine-4-hydroxylase